MKKVNEQDILKDYEALLNKRAEKLIECQEQAIAYARERGYDEATTESFVLYVQRIENGGLNKEDSAKLEILSAYIYEESEAEAIIQKEENLI